LDNIAIEQEQSTFKAIGITAPCTVQAGLSLTVIRFTVCTELKKADIYLGRGDLERLNIVKWNLPRQPFAEGPVARDNPQARNTDDDEIESYERQHVVDSVHPEDIPHAHRQAVRDQIAKWLASGKIKEKRSNFNLPLTTAIKRDADGKILKVRVCLDPRSINSRLIPDKFTIPRIDEIHQSFEGMTYFTELDCEDAFLQMRLCARDQDVLAFTFEGVQYVFVGAPYGVKIMSNTFQRNVQALFADMPFVRVYIDNVVIASRNWQEHVKHVRLVIERMNTLNIKLNAKKLKIGRRSLRILGREVSADGIRPDPVKVQKVLDWPFPADCRALQSFLGIVNYLRSHLYHLSTIEEPLNKARANQEAFEREITNNRPAMESAFKTIKQAIATIPLLRYPKMDRPFHVAPDASRTGLGAVLYQLSDEQEDTGDTSICADNIVMIASRSLTAYERNYGVFKLELLAVVFALEQFKDFLYGSPFHLHSDHRALMYVLDGKSRKNHPTINGWIAQLQDFTFTIDHTVGLLNILPDCLSRIFSKSGVWGVSKSPDAPAAAQSSAKPQASLSALSGSQRTTAEREAVMQMLGKTIPNEQERKELIERVHNEGHYGSRICVEKIYHYHNKWWPTMRKDVENHLQHCDPCVKYGVKKHGFHPARSPEVSEPWQWLQVDIIYMPPSENGYLYILTLIDLFSSFVLTKALRTRSAAEVSTTLFEWFAAFGFPSILQSDAGKEFTSKVLKKMAEIYKIDVKISTPYHKGSVGSIERLNRTLTSSLKKLLAGATNKWDSQLAIATYYYNTTTRSLTKSSPYSIIFARQHSNGGEDAEPTSIDCKNTYERRSDFAKPSSPQSMRMPLRRRPKAIDGWMEKDASFLRWTLALL
jgi:transposase InsO family protein